MVTGDARILVGPEHYGEQLQTMVSSHGKTFPGYKRDVEHTENGIIGIIVANDAVTVAVDGLGVCQSRED